MSKKKNTKLRSPIPLWCIPVNSNLWVPIPKFYTKFSEVRILRVTKEYFKLIKTLIDASNSVSYNICAKVCRNILCVNWEPINIRCLIKIVIWCHKLEFTYYLERAHTNVTGVAQRKHITLSLGAHDRCDRVYIYDDTEKGGARSHCHGCGCGVTVSTRLYACICMYVLMPKY